MTDLVHPFVFGVPARLGNVRSGEKLELWRGLLALERVDEEAASAKLRIRRRTFAMKRHWIAAAYVFVQGILLPLWLLAPKVGFGGIHIMQLAFVVVLVAVAFGRREAIWILAVLLSCGVSPTARRFWQR